MDGELKGERILDPGVVTAANMVEQLVLNDGFSCKLDDLQIHNYP